ncbi:hypothetical protein K438DRAFT_1787334 [Mycena galopus ATCC 62051]|nr:hypothetical protein K438DRAFT_1787334 [Mycena galopus ATCC 62051]
MALGPGSSSEHSALPNMDDETVQVVIGSAGDGDMGSLGALFKLQASLSVGDIHLRDKDKLIYTSFTTIFSKNYPYMENSRDVYPPAGSDSAFSQPGGMLVEALKRADGLCDVISQIENVAKIQELYGLQTG